MRTFIAVEIPDEVKQRIGEVQARLRKAAVDASWPRPEGIHLTLKFLGEVPESEIAAITGGLHKAAAGHPPFRLEVAGAGAFPTARNARVLWIGLAGELGKLAALQGAVEGAMTAIGREREERPFKPHLTLARVKFIRSRESLLKALEQEKDVTLPGFDVTALSLMQSELKRTGSEYTEIARVELR